jgi:hypothetical protein
VAALTEKVLRVHVALIVAEGICLSAFLFELSRARSGNTLSWAYVFEWPILGAYGVYVWRKLLRSGRGEAPSAPPTSREVDALERYNRYLGEVHRGEGPSSTGE